MGFELVYLEPVVEVGYFGQSFGGDQPDSPSAGIVDVVEGEVSINVSGGQDSDALLL